LGYNAGGGTFSAQPTQSIVMNASNSTQIVGGINSIILNTASTSYNITGQRSICLNANSTSISSNIDSVVLNSSSTSLSVGANSILISATTQAVSSSTNSILLNASNATLTGVANGTVIKPINSTSDGTLKSMVYNNTTGELLYSATKTFVINHPDDNDKYLVHGCLEGPEAGVYYRGSDEIINNKSKEIILPEYTKHWKDFTISVNPIIESNDYENIRFYGTSNVKDGKFTVFATNGCKFHWTVFAKRYDINVEPMKDSVKLSGNGPYTWIE